MGLTAGPHLPVTGAKRKREAALAGPAGSKLGQPGLPAQARQSPLALDPSRAKKKGRENDWACWGEIREEREKVFFFKKFFSNSLFKLSNFNQTEIHAFES
jgi:hypothetical protein